MHNAAHVAALGIHGADQAQHAACVLGLGVGAEAGQTIDKIPLAGVPARQRLARQGAVQQPLGLYAAAAIDQQRGRGDAFLGAVVQHGGRQLLRRSAGGPRLPVGVQVGEQQPDTRQIHHAPVRAHEFGLRQPGVAGLIDHAQDRGHVCEPV